MISQGGCIIFNSVLLAGDYADYTLTAILQLSGAALGLPSGKSHPASSSALMLVQLKRLSPRPQVAPSVDRREHSTLLVLLRGEKKEEVGCCDDWFFYPTSGASLGTHQGWVYSARSLQLRLPQRAEPDPGFSGTQGESACPRILGTS